MEKIRMLDICIRTGTEMRIGFLMSFGYNKVPNLGNDCHSVAIEDGPGSQTCLNISDSDSVA